jgi:putative nucleotidyltransferase with HDIG domain
VVGPLTRAEEEEPYGVVRGHRDIALVVPFVSVTVVVMVLVIMSGAFTAMIMLRRFVRRAERAFADDQKVIDALDRRLKHSLHELEEHSVGTLQALVAAVDARDTYTAHHSLNVSDYSCAIARQMGLRDELGALERAGLLHDIGKIGVSEYALLKPGRLTPEEYASIKEHSEIGARIIEMAPFLSTIVPVIRHHHERWDGEGYPAGLAGEDIPQLSRILGVADALDAMTSHRSYRNALSVTRARKELIEGRGSQFDPAVVDATVALLDSQAILPRRIAPATV